MTYVYDLLININDYEYSFYEWKETDNIEYLKKGILIRVSNYIYKKIVSNNIIIGDKTLSLINNKSCILKDKRIETIPYMCVFTNGKDAIGVIFSSKGKIISKSKFMVQDELEIFEASKGLKTVRIDYREITNEKVCISFNLREEKETIDYILKNLEKIKEDKAKIEYLYYEWFDRKISSNNPYRELIEDIKYNYGIDRKEFLELLDLVIVKNNA